MVAKVPVMQKVADARPAEGERPSASPIYRNPRAVEAFPTLPTGDKTLYDLFSTAAKKYANNECLGRRSGAGYAWQTYKQVEEAAAQIASASKHMGVDKFARVGIFGQNSPEWMTAMQACNRQGFTCVPLYDTLGENAIEYIVNHAEVSIVFTADAKLAQFNKALPKVQDHLKAIVYWPAGGLADGALDAAKESGVPVHSWEEFLKLGQDNFVAPDPPAPEDYSTYMYTSGTTGDPKGVMLTHNSLMYMAAGIQVFLKDVNVELTHTDVFLSFLPLAHIFDRVIEEAFLYVGGRIGYWGGNVVKLLDDLAALQPTIFAAVPRVYDRIYGKVTDTVNAAGGFKKWVFTKAYSGRVERLKGGAPESQIGFLDKIAFGKPRAALGPRVRVLVSGGAPLAPHVEEFLKVVMCVPTVQGYGLTETCAASFLAIPSRWSTASSVGVVMPACEVRLESVPDMNYDALAKPPKGEVLIRGPSIFSGYYKMPEKTAEDLDSEGWFHTGDIGVFQPVGKDVGFVLKIVDRKKNIFKLAQGEYIAVEKVEATYGKDALVDQIWVYGNSFESSLVAVVVPNPDNLKALGQRLGVSGDTAKLCKDPKVIKGVYDSMTATAKADKLKGFEMVKAISLEPKPFDQHTDAELMTPTFKLKRPQLLKYYQSTIDELYAETKKDAKPAQ